MAYLTLSLPTSTILLLSNQNPDLVFPMTKTAPLIFATLVFIAGPLLGQQAPVGTGTVVEVEETIYDFFDTFEAPVLYITGTALDDRCTISNAGPTGLQITLNGVDHPVDPASYIYRSSFEGLAGDDRFVFEANDFPNWNFTARGGDGDDFMQNLTAVNFSMSGQNGDDTLRASVADWTGIGSVSLEYSNDFISGNPFVTSLFGGPGNDTFYGGSGGVRMYGSAGDDTFRAGGGDDLIYGGDGDDTIHAGAGNDRVYGGAGMDTIHGGPGNDHLDSGRYSSFRIFDNQRTVTGDVAGTIIAGGGNDYIITGPEVDTVEASFGQNVLESPEVADNVTGSPSSIEDVAQTDALDGSGLVIFNEAYVGFTIRDVTIVGTPFKDYCIIDDNGVVLNGVRYDAYGEYFDFRGFEGDDTFVYRRTAAGVFGFASGGPGEDILSTRSGEINLDGNDGNDILHDMYGTGTTGGPGDDIFYLRNASRSTTVDGGDGDDLIFGGHNGNHIGGGNGNDTIYGGDLTDTIFGGSGADFIAAGAGDDEIDSGIVLGHTFANPDGDDTVLGGPGNDTIKTGRGNDIVNGGDGNDTILSGPDDDEIRGGDGDDDIKSGLGNDTINGGFGDDTITAGPDNDDVNGAGGNDTISLGNGNDIGHGGSGDDTINGNSGDDTITGGPGTNVLIGGPGENTID